MIDLSTIPDDVLIARGKYSTLSRQANQRRREIRDHMHSLTEQARTVVRLLELDAMPVSAQENLDNMTNLLVVSITSHQELEELLPVMAELKLQAYPKGKRK